MKRKVISLCLLFAFIGIVAAGIIFLTSDKGSGSPETGVNKQNTEQIRYTVCEGAITNTYQTEGYVISGSPEVYMDKIIIRETGSKNFKLYIKKGDDVKRGDKIFTINNKSTKAAYDFKLVDVVKGSNSTELHVLNYGKLYICTSLESGRIGSVKYDTPVTVIINGVEIRGRVEEIGFEIHDNLIDVRVGFDCRALPGARAKLRFITGVKKAGLFVPAGALYKEGEEYFAQKAGKDGKIEKVEIKTGEHFSMADNNVVTECIEIVSGAVKGDKLVVDVMKDKK